MCVRDGVDSLELLHSILSTTAISGETRCWGARRKWWWCVCPPCKCACTELAGFSWQSRWIRSHTGSQDQSQNRKLKNVKYSRQKVEKHSHQEERNIRVQGRRDSAWKLHVLALQVLYITPFVSNVASPLRKALNANSWLSDDYMAPSGCLLGSVGANNCSNGYMFFYWYHSLLLSYRNFLLQEYLYFKVARKGQYLNQGIKCMVKALGEETLGW